MATSLSPPRMVVIGNPENRRLAFFTEAVKAHGHQPPRVVAYADLLAGRISLEEALAEVDLVRLESPGENLEVERGLIALGAGEENHYHQIDAAAAANLSEDKGRIRYLHQWYLGYSRLMSRIVAGAEEGTAFMNRPEVVVDLFDKRVCHKLLAAADVPKPKLLGGLQDYGQLRDLMRQQGCRRVFVKPCSGSSASGVVALAAYPNRLKAYSSVLARNLGDEPRLYNSLKIQVYEHEPQLAAVIDCLARENCIVEEWLPKASWCGRGFDLRVVVIAGQATHLVARTSRSPMTNLHLGNRRGDLESIRQHLGQNAWRELIACAERAARAFPGALYCGVDILVRARGYAPAVIEVNAFGDLLPGICWRGMDTYTAEYAACLVARDQQCAKTKAYRDISRFGNTADPDDTAKSGYKDL